MGTLRCTEAHAVSDDDGVPLVFAPGDLVDSGNKWAKKNPQHWETVEAAAERVARPVEQATAAPGEKRSVTKPAKKTAAKKAADEDDKGE